MFAERVQQVRAKVAQLIADYEARHPGQKVPQTDIRFDLRGRAAGMAGQRGWNYFMRFNKDMMTNEGWDHLFKNTVPHELAHVICFANGSDRGHGYFWRKTCIELGGNGERCHKETVTYAKGNTYVYTTSTGHTVNVSQVKHRRIQAGGKYLFRDRKMGYMDKTCAYSLLGSTTVVKPAVSPRPAAPVVTAPVAKVGVPYVTAAGSSKAELVRGRIAQAKARNEGMEVVIAWAMDCLGMTRTLARTYVAGNWNRA